MPGKMTVTAYIDCSGPIFDGSAEQAVTELVRDIAKRGAEWAQENLRDAAMDKTGRAHGGFQANLRVVEKSAGWSVPGPMIRGVTWAPWLEGVSKRNKSTKFKGYRPFAKTRADLEDSEAQRIADETLEQYMPRFGGDAE